MERRAASVTAELLVSCFTPDFITKKYSFVAVRCFSWLSCLGTTTMLKTNWIDSFCLAREVKSSQIEVESNLNYYYVET